MQFCPISLHTLYHPDKKRQRQGSNLRSQREIAQQATALTTRPRCPIPDIIPTDSPSRLPTYHYRLPTHAKDLFLKKRQWQDLNLRIQRIIDFKSIALDHSATLSSTSISPYTLLVSADIPDYLHLYLHISTSIHMYLPLYHFYPDCLHFPFSTHCCPHLPSPSLYSVISNSIVGQYLRLSRERPGFESPLESFYFFFCIPLQPTSSSFSPPFVCMGVQLRWQSIRFACEGHGDRYPAPPSFYFFYFYRIKNYAILSHFSSYSIPSRQKTTTAGFEPTLPKGNCLAGNRLNHSATLSYTRYHPHRLTIQTTHLPLQTTHTCKRFIFEKTTVAGFEPTHPEDN